MLVLDVTYSYWSKKNMAMFALKSFASNAIFDLQLNLELTKILYFVLFVPSKHSFGSVVWCNYFMWYHNFIHHFYEDLFEWETLPGWNISIIYTEHLNDK